MPCYVAETVPGELQRALDALKKKPDVEQVEMVVFEKFIYDQLVRPILVVVAHWTTWEQRSPAESEGVANTAEVGRLDFDTLVSAGAVAGERAYRVEVDADASGNTPSQWRVMRGNDLHETGSVADDPTGNAALFAGFASARAVAPMHLTAPKSNPSPFPYNISFVHSL